MSKQVIFTFTEINNKKRQVAALIGNNRLEGFEIGDNYCGDASDFTIGDIIVAKIAEVKESIGGMFVNISPKDKAYLPFRELKNPVIVNKYSKSDGLVAGDEILVQIIKDAIKTKDPVVSTKLTFEGKGFLLTTYRNEVGVSKKLSETDAQRFKENARRILDGNKDFGLIVRTNAISYSDEEFCESLFDILKITEQLLVESKHKKVYSVVKKAAPSFISYLASLKEDDIEKVLTDDENIYNDIVQSKNLLSRQIIEKTLLYKDDSISLSALYGLNSKMSELTEKKVYLKSGAYIIIEQTETMTVIDVNSGKKDKGYDEDYFYNINSEAAQEIARQLRLRNISGMILVDFINMGSEKEETTLLKEMRHLLKSDSVKCDALDITKLGLMEITRKKGKRSLAEVLKE
ncbi:MAG: ribonuclease E/G [Lachnospiraceae bacterium]|nr:ribonuclease E/G [Lachnospiraceae bacterium]